MLSKSLAEVSVLVFRIKKEEAQPPPPPHVPAGCNWRPVWDEGHRAYYYCTLTPRLSLAFRLYSASPYLRLIVARLAMSTRSC